MNKNLIFDVEDKPKFGQKLIFALQQLLAILAATIAVPTIIGIPTQPLFWAQASAPWSTSS